MHLSTSPIYNYSFYMNRFLLDSDHPICGSKHFKVEIQSSVLETTVFNLLVHLSQKDTLITQFPLDIELIMDTTK